MLASFGSQLSRGAGGFAELVPAIKGGIPKLSTAKPGLLAILQDTSGSMSFDFAQQQGIAKADAVADVTNEIIEGWVMRMNQGGTIKNRIDVLLASYGGNGVRRGNIAKLSELADNYLEKINTQDIEGNPITRPIWVRPESAGGTPMRAAFSALRKDVAAWSRRPQAEHLLLGVHITDGESTDGSPRQELEQLAAEVSAQGGKLLMTNIHLSESGTPDQAVVFPTPAEAARFDEFGKMLFEMSSPVPPALAEQLRTRPGARMMAFNAGFEEMAKVFEAGSSVAAP